MNRHWRTVAAAVMMGAAFQTVARAEWYVGAELGRVKHEFRPEYAYAWGGPNDRYTNRARGTELDLLAGFHFAMYRYFSVAIQARASGNDAAWKLNVYDAYPDLGVEGEARLEYEIPYSGTLSVLPEFHLWRFTAFGELGVGGAWLHESKESAVSSSYDYRKLVPLATAGAGLRLALLDNLDAFVVYRETFYDRVNYDSNLPDGSVVESISDKPVSWSVTGGFVFRFPEE
jgi:opacity protein-like surface antigen